LKGGRKLLCANLANPALAGAARGRDAAPATAPGLSTGHGPPRATRDRSLVATTVPSLSARHRPPPTARGCGAAPAAAPGLSTRHGHLRVARGRGLAIATKLRWTYGQNNSEISVSRARASACCSRSGSRCCYQVAMDLRSK